MAKRGIMTQIIATLLLLALSLAPAMAQQPEKKKQTPPPGGAPKPFTVPPTTTFALPNGLRVTLAPYGQVPKVAVAVITRAGNLNEAAEQVWLADITGEMMKEGTTSKTTHQVADEAATMGGQIAVTVGVDQTRTQLEVLSEFGPRAVALLADVVQRPRLPESELPRLKADAMRRLSIEKSQPQSLALERFRKVLYPDHPYGRLFPTEEMIGKYAVADVRKFYQDNFGAARSHLYVVGKFNAAAMKKAIAAEFGEWQKGPEPLVLTPKPRSGRVLEMLERNGAPQSTLYIGLPVVYPGTPDYVPMVVMNALLGGSFGSRITQNIRENKGFTYSPFSTLSSRYRDAYWVQVADVTTKDTGASLKEIFFEIDRLRVEAPSAAELKGIQNYLSGVFIIQNSSRNGIISQLNFVDLHGLGPDYLRTYVQKVTAVTPQQVREVASTYLAPEKMAIVVVGDSEKVAEQVAPYKTAASSR